MSAQSQKIRVAEQLKPRRRDILKLLASGKNTKMIAIELGQNEKTVEYHRLQLMIETGLFSYAELTQLAIRLNLITITV